MLSAVVLAAALTALVPETAKAEPIGYYKLDGVEYDASVPVPESVIGYGLGDKPVRHDLMVTYLRQLAEVSDRLTVETIGKSHEGRPILFFVVTAPENHARLDTIRETHLKGLEPGAGPVDKGNPAVIWINYGVHGAESSGMDAAIPMLYHLAAAQGPDIDRILKTGVIVITAIFNPDGHARRIDHATRFGGAVPVTDPGHIQHDLWIEARTNHYWFDLNRQWLLLSQPESRAWVKKWHHWKPLVSADYHEMGSNATYYFHPGVPQRKNPLIPDRARALLKRISDHHVRFLDSEAQLYYSEEGFDNFYIGKGSTYPFINGGIGILFEAGAARGGRLESDNGEKVYADNIRTHFRTSLTTIEGALAAKDDIAAYRRDFFAGVAQEARQDATKAYVFAAPGDAARDYTFLKLLASHDIKAYRLARDISAGGKTFAKNRAHIVPMNQTQYWMIRGIFDRVTEFRESIFYDVSGWTLPLAYDLDYAALEGRQYAESLLGDPAKPEFPVFAAPEKAPYGYMFEWTGYYAPRALYRLLDAGLITRVAFKPVTVETSDGMVSLRRGAIFVPFARQEKSADEIHAIIETIAAEDGVKVHGVISGRSATVGADLGAPSSFRVVRKPSVLLLIGDGINYYDAGETWHLLDHRMRMPVTLRRQSELAGIDWSRYTHILMPSGGNLNEKTADRLKLWMTEEGGVLIASRQSALWAQDTYLASKDDAEKDGKEKPSADESDKAENGEEAEEKKPLRYDYSDFDVREAEHVIGGALFETDVDISHPIGFGFLDRMLASQRNTTLVLDRPEGDPYAVPVVYSDKPLLSGYASPRRLEEIAGTPMTVTKRMGQGALVLFADNTNFRGTFYGTNRLFMNAVFFADLIDTTRGEYKP